MDKIWLKSYPPGVPAEIDASQLHSLKELVEKTCAQHADRVAFVQMDAELTYRQVGDLSRAFAAWLQHAGFARGDRFAIMLPTTLQYPIALFGALRAGLVVVNTNPLYSAPELEHQLRDSGAKALVGLANFAHNAATILAKTDVRLGFVSERADLHPPLKRTLINFVARYIKRIVPPFSIPGAIGFREA